MLEIYPPPYEGIYHPLEVEYEILFKNSDLENKYQEYCKREIIARTASRRSWFQLSIAQCHAIWRDEFNRNFIVPEQEIFPITSKSIAIQSLFVFDQNIDFVPKNMIENLKQKLNNAKIKYELTDNDSIALYSSNYGHRIWQVAKIPSENSFTRKSNDISITPMIKVDFFESLINSIQSTNLIATYKLTNSEIDQDRNIIIFTYTKL